jgi:AraC family transcriptional activator of tynA and feaB
LESYSTEALPVQGRTAAWNALYSSRMSHVEFTPGDRDKFGAELRIGQFGPMKLARLMVDRCSVERGLHHIMPHGPRLFNFLLQAEGSSTFYHCGNASRLEAGDVVLVDTALPHHFCTQDVSVTVMARVQSDLLRAYLPSPEQFCGVPLTKAVGISATAAAMMKSLAEVPDSGVGPACEARIARYLLEMISMSYASGSQIEAGSSAILWQRRNSVVRYIEDNLRDPELTPATVATNLRISSRYLRTIFAVSGEKVSAYILRRRLEECARQIRSSAWHGHTMIEIAFSWGFNSAPHFTRSFRSQFGETPRDYRRLRKD